MHIGGNFVKNPDLQYIGGDEVVWHVDSDRLSYWVLLNMGEEATIEGERSTAFEGAKKLLKVRDIVLLRVLKHLMRVRKQVFFKLLKQLMRGEETSAFEVVKGEAKIAFMGETKGVVEVQTKRLTKIETDFVFDTENSSKTEGLGFISTRRDGYGADDGSLDLNSTRDDNNGSEREQNFHSDVKSGSETDYIMSSTVGKLRQSRRWKDALVEFVVARRFDYKLVRNEKDKVSLKCKCGGYLWEIYASVDNGDGFFKGPFNGELITTVGRDANDQIYPIAWAVIEKEN
ncbi:hypothetical protein V6N13_122469 [Hibiscus sabdariffa]